MELGLAADRTQSGAANISGLTSFTAYFRPNDGPFKLRVGVYPRVMDRTICNGFLLLVGQVRGSLARQRPPWHPSLVRTCYPPPSAWVSYAAIAKSRFTFARRRTATCRSGSGRSQQFLRRNRTLLSTFTVKLEASRRSIQFRHPTTRIRRGAGMLAGKFN